MMKYDLVIADGAGVDDHDEKRLMEKGPFEEGSASLDMIRYEIDSQVGVD